MKFVKAIVFTLLCTTSWTQSNIQISLITGDPGDDLYTTFGHSAFKVTDTVSQREVLYNYGTFDFGTPNFYIKFMRGKLPYFLSRGSYRGFLNYYNRAERSVTEQVLNLDSLQRQQMLYLLEENAKEANKYYQYDFFYDNCATRLDVLLREVAEEKLNYDGNIDSLLTFRNILDEHLSGMPWTDFGIDLIIGSKADKPTSIHEQMFAPSYLAAYFRQANIGNKPLVSQEETIINFHEVRKDRLRAKGWLSPTVLFGILLIFECLLLFLFLAGKPQKWSKYLDLLWFIVCGLAGFIIFFLWFMTDHDATALNWNILWLNPLFLLLPFFVKRNYSKPLAQKTIILLGITTLLYLLFHKWIPQSVNTACLIAMVISLLKFVRIALNNRQHITKSD